MRSLSPLTVLWFISLVALQPLPAAAAAEAAEEEERPGGGGRLGLLNELTGQASTSGSQTRVSVPSAAPSRPPQWPPTIPRHQPAAGARRAPPSLAWARRAEGPRGERRAMRARRHAHTGSRGGHHYPHHAQLMRVGCVLGTCQVQNLSHRLYQLIGQSGREDSSPINPRSPHSYG